MTVTLVFLVQRVYSRGILRETAVFQFKQDEKSVRVKKTHQNVHQMRET